VNRRVKVLIFSAVALVVFAIASHVIGGDELQILIDNWLKGKPRMIVKLEISLPKVDADKCIVHVRRFPTMYNPTKDGYTEPVYTGVHKPGAKVTVGRILNAYVAKYEADERTGQLRVGYYEPQEFLVLVGCVKDGRQVYSWARIVEVRPKTAIYTERVDAPALAQKPSTTQQAGGSKARHEDGGGVGASTPTGSSPRGFFTCNIVVREEDGKHGRGYCITWVGGPYLYSTSGLTARFCLKGGTPASAVYIEAFWSPYPGAKLRGVSGVEWSSAGEKLASSIVTACSSPLTGNHRDRICFQVRYQYEWGVYWCDSSSGICYGYQLLYPVLITSIASSSQLGLTPTPENYTPPSSPPPHAYLGAAGFERIYFGRYGAHESDAILPLPGTIITFTYADRWSAPLTVHLYRAGRFDSQYVTPYVEVSSSRTFHWWFRGDDPMSYEILFSPG
jgi:hypothetical protein